MVEEFFGIILGAFEPQQLPHAARPKHVVPHDARIGERVEPDIGAVARECLLHRQHRMSGAIKMHEAMIGERICEGGGGALKRLLIGVGRALRDLDKAADVESGHKFLPFQFCGEVYRLARRQPAPRAPAIAAPTRPALVPKCADLSSTARKCAGRRLMSAGRMSGASTSSAAETPPAKMTTAGSRSPTAPESAAPSDSIGPRSAEIASASSLRALSMSAAPPRKPRPAAMRSSARPDAMRSSEPAPSSHASSSVAAAKPNEQAPPCAPATMRPSARTPEPIPVPIAMRIASERLTAAPAEASASKENCASLPTVVSTPGSEAAMSSPSR